MSPRTRDDLDGRIRRAWPDDGSAVVRPHSPEALRAEIDRRILTGADPLAHTVPQVDRTVDQRSRRLATVLAAVVLLAGAAGVGGLLVARLGEPPQDQVRLTGDPVQDLRTAATTTRRVLDSTTVIRTARMWAARTDDVEGLRRHMAANDPTLTRVQMQETDGDWSDEITSPDDLMGMGVRRVGDRTYIQVNGDTRGDVWFRITPSTDQLPDVPPIDAPVVLDALDRAAGVGADVEVRDDGAALRYRLVGGAALDAWLARIDDDPSVDGSSAVERRGMHAEMVVTVAADTGLLQSIRTVSFVDDGPQGYVRQTVVTFDSGDDPPAVVAPTNTEDVTYEELCALHDMSCELPEEATP